MPTPRRPGRKSPPQDKATGRFDHGTAPDPAQEARAADTLAEIAALSRAPFRRILQRYADAAPSPEALAAQAEKFPDRWAQGLAIAGRLAGYSEKLEIEGTLDVHHLHRLSDMELEHELQVLQDQLDALPPASSAASHRRPSAPPHEPAPSRTYGWPRGRTYRTPHDAPGRVGRDRHLCAQATAHVAELPPQDGLPRGPLGPPRRQLAYADRRLAAHD